VKVIAKGPLDLGLLRWLEQLFKMQGQNPSRKLTLPKPEGTLRVGRPAISWLDSVEGGFKTMGLEIEDESHRIGTNGEQ
jgi:hypothetical protein